MSALKGAAGRDAVLLGAGACTVMAGALIAPALAAMHAALGHGGEGAWLSRLALVLPALIVAVSAPFAGALADRLGRRHVLVAALALLAASGAAGALSSGYGWLLASRAALGLASALVLSTATALIADAHQGAGRRHMLARQAMANTFGGVIFLLIGGALAALGWRLPFVLYLLAAPLAYFALRLPTAEAASTAAPRLSPPKGLLPIMLAMIAFYLVPTRAAFVLDDMAAGPALVGVVIAAATLAGGLGAMAAPRLEQRFGHAGALAAASVLICIGLLGFALAALPLEAGISGVLLGAGFGIIPPLAANQVMAGIEPAERGAAGGWISSALFAGQFFAMALGEAAAYALGPRAPFLAGMMLIATAFSAIIWKKSAARQGLNTAI